MTTLRIADPESNASAPSDTAEYMVPNPKSLGAAGQPDRSGNRKPAGSSAAGDPAGESLQRRDVDDQPPPRGMTLGRWPGTTEPGGVAVRPAPRAGAASFPGVAGLTSDSNALYSSLVRSRLGK